MSSVKVTEGHAPFKYPSLPKPCSTWYKVYGDLKNSSNGRPLVILHGGPGSCHNYMLSLTDLAEQYGIAVVFYDQIGNGNSTHLREKRLDGTFWKEELFMAELDNLVEHLGIASSFDILGQSWGGMLGATYAIRGHPGLKRIVISNSPASLKLWVDACNETRTHLPQDVADALTKHEKTQTFEDQEYKDACLFWYKRHLCQVYPFPDYVAKSLELMESDDTVYFTMNGPSEFTVIGCLKGFDLTEQTHKITIPTLVLNGEFDAADDKAVAAFVNGIKGAKWHKFMGTSHMSHVEEREKYMTVVSDFLK